MRRPGRLTGLGHCVCTPRIRPRSLASAGRISGNNGGNTHAHASIAPARAVCFQRIQIASTFHTSSARRRAPEDSPGHVLDRYKATFDVPKATHGLEELGLDHIGSPVIVYGYINAIRAMSKKLVFADLLDKTLSTSMQLVCTSALASNSVEFAQLQTQTPVCIQGLVQRKKDKSVAGEAAVSDWSGARKNDEVEIKILDFSVLNSFPVDIKFSDLSTFGPDQRHLQIRHNKPLRNALALRSRLAALCRNFLQHERNFVEIETPQLFKSTPEGAREFLVPTRIPEQAYALPQSPQQYKQILMASGIPRYFQIARCFRDEDLRADRQPEFTQLDLEMSFADGSDVMATIETLVKRIWSELLDTDLGTDQFSRMSYHDAMTKYGSDKPDTRLGMNIVRVGHLLPAGLITKIGPLAEPIVDAFKFGPSQDPKETRKFVADFMSSAEAAPFLANPDGQPGIFIFDPRNPLSGLSPFGFEAAEFLENELSLEEGDIVVIQARKDAPFSGGSTQLGNLRLAMHRAAVAAGIIDRPTGWSFLWINNFPLFSPTNDTDPGQGGSAGIASTHHPFTAPRSAADVDLLATDPLSARAEHYDLVLNGVELGGGSRRIHHAAMQEYVLRQVLRMPDERLAHFEHLLEVLRAGCPPHAGIALGFDRLAALLVGSDSIRDVIAFPKDGRGRDALVGSPSAMEPKQLATYHLKLAKSG